MDDISPYIEVADEATLRRTLHVVMDHLDRLRQVATASVAMGESAKGAAQDSHALALAAAQAWCSAAPPRPDLAADAVETYFCYLGFATAAFHINFCVN
ncbi:MAG TPA: hypothetical protein VIV12_08910 [Streptosporangiaceae bacterium]